MVVKRGEKQKFFQELGLYTMALENLPKFKDICDGTFPNPVHECVHEEEDISNCTMLKWYQFAKYLQQCNKLHANGAIKLWYSKKGTLAQKKGGSSGHKSRLRPPFFGPNSVQRLECTFEKRVLNRAV
ncbi:hypothetical protein TNCV_4558181 [Trichonephila clavipes]|nr:hypothetical protein TNCV_4558181 [Trichonephila clavipes]